MPDSQGVAPIFLSIIIPAYNEERRLPGTLQTVSDYLARQAYTAEIIVVENGSTDRTADVVREFARQHTSIRLIVSKRRGKGLAVKMGMLAARGAYRFLCDADLSMPIEELARFLPPALDGFGVAVGSREAAGARRYREPAYRHLMGRVFNWIVKLVAVPGLEDTQAGFKCFIAQVAEDLFRLQTLEGFSFDVEILFLAGRRGYRVVEVPIDWYFMTDTRVRPVRDTFCMVRDVLLVRWNDLRGVYGA